MTDPKRPDAPVCDGCGHLDSEHEFCVERQYCNHAKCRCIDGVYLGTMEGAFKAIWTPEELADLDAQVEARARLAEAKWWEHLVGAVNEGEQCKDDCMYCERIAELESAARESGGQA